MPKNVHSPFPASLRSESDKASQILEDFITPSWTGRPGTEIPKSVLANAKGLLILTVVRVGFLGSVRSGSGVVVVRLSDGSWSPPSAIAMAGFGGGGQFGAELTDFVFILNTTSAVRTFAQTGSLTLGVNISMAVGPVGRSAEFEGGTGLKSTATMYSYSKTRGLYGGLTVEFGLMVERSGANRKLYNQRVGVKDLLSEEIAPPPEVEPLMRVLALEAFRPSDHPRDISEAQPEIPVEVPTQPLSETLPELLSGVRIEQSEQPTEVPTQAPSEPLQELPAEVPTQPPSEVHSEFPGPTEHPGTGQPGESNDVSHKGDGALSPARDNHSP